MSQHENHAFSGWYPRHREGLVALDRRGMLKVSMAGLAGLTLPGLLAERARAGREKRPMNRRKSVILLWMTGGPSHIDTWDPKPDRPYENRGPFGVIQTKLPGALICEHLPKQAAMLDKFTIIRSVDARKSDHEPNMVFQTGHRESRPRRNSKGFMYPAIGSIVAKHHGANRPGMPAYIAFQKHPWHIAYSGYLEKRYDPFIANQTTKLPKYTNTGKDTGQTIGGELFQFSERLTLDRVNTRQQLLRQFDRMRRDLDLNGSMDAVDHYRRAAVEMVTGPQVRDAFDLSQEPDGVRARYGNHLWCQQTLLARRLVEAGASFVTVDLSYHPASGTWDNHGVPGCLYRGISKGLGPLLPTFDHLLTTLVRDLEERHLLDDVLVIAMGEFGRTPKIGTENSVDGRSHWPVVMSMSLAGGGLRHGQIIGATQRDGGDVKERPIIPGDIAATIYRHMEVPLDTTYTDHRGRPRYILDDGGEPIRELL